MSKNKTPKPQDPNESAATSAAETFFSGEAASPESTPLAAKNKWLIPGVAFASAALLAGALGFAFGSNNSPDMRPVAMSGQAFGQNDGQNNGQKLPHCHDAAGNDVDANTDGTCVDGSAPGFRGGKNASDQQGQGKNRGSGQINSGDGQKLPHCHDAAGNDADANTDGTCVDGSAPGFRGGKNASPAPTTSSSPTVQ